MFGRVRDLLGYLVLNEDGAILSSDGELENAEAAANVFTTIVSLADKLEPDEGKYRKLTITFSDCAYVVCLSNRKYHVAKLRFQPPQTPHNSEEDLSASGDT